MSKLFQDLFIFEIANNHQGSVDHGLAIIDSMARIARTKGIKAAVKFQYRDLDSFIHPDFVTRKDVKHIPRFLETRLTDNEFRTLQEAVRSAGLITVTTPFDEPSVEKCVDHGVDVIKVASCSANDWPLLEAIARTHKPVIASTGGLSIYEIDNLVSFFNHKKVDFALLHCVGVYPTPNNMLHLSFVERLVRRYPNVTIGYSGHEAPDNHDVVIAAVSKGARILERHVGIPSETVKLNSYSMTPEQSACWVAAALRAKEIAGNGDGRNVSQDELDSLQSLKRGVYARRTMKKGEEIQREDVFFAMPCVAGQTASGEFGQLRSHWIASRDYEPNEPVREHSSIDRMIEIRRIVHDAKGLLSEAHIVLAEDDQIELSHHYGLEKFRTTGALIVNVVNREYCKKLVIMLPSQSHPVHRHKLKEETFQLIWGDLQITLNGITQQLRRGNKILVERGTWHSFSSEAGAIFEEVSTKHVVGDSYYEDERVARLDPLERKTLLEGW
jgi:N-acetylneuraminate synthase